MRASGQAPRCASSRFVQGADVCVQSAAGCTHGHFSVLMDCLAGIHVFHSLHGGLTVPLCRAVAQCMQGGHRTDVHEYCCAQGCQKPDGFNNADGFAGAMHEGDEWNMYATMEVASNPPVTSCGLTDIAVSVCRCLNPLAGVRDPGCCSGDAATLQHDTIWSAGAQPGGGGGESGRHGVQLNPPFTIVIFLTHDCSCVHMPRTPA